MGESKIANIDLVRTVLSDAINIRYANVAVLAFLLYDAGIGSSTLLRYLH